MPSQSTAAPGQVSSGQPRRAPSAARMTPAAGISRVRSRRGCRFTRIGLLIASSAASAIRNTQLRIRLPRRTGGASVVSRAGVSDVVRAVEAMRAFLASERIGITQVTIANAQGCCQIYRAAQIKAAQAAFVRVARRLEPPGYRSRVWRFAATCRIMLLVFRPVAFSQWS